MKSLKTIQTIYKIAKVISEIVLICSIVTLSLSALGMALTAVYGAPMLEAADMKFFLMDEGYQFTVPEIYCVFSLGIIMSAASIVVSKFAYRYFVGELKAGTPFTLEGAKELKTLGILAIAVSISSSIVSAIIIEICKKANGYGIGFDVGLGGYISIGITFLILSVIFKCGAEMIGEKGENIPDEYGEDRGEDGFGQYR